MDKHKRKKHWETIFETKRPTDVSWYQETPEPSLSFLKGLDLPETAKIIDIGAGDSFFVDNLIKLGYRNITVLDVSAKALERAKKRPGQDAFPCRPGFSFLQFQAFELNVLVQRRMKKGKHAGITRS